MASLPTVSKLVLIILFWSSVFFFLIWIYGDENENQKQYEDLQKIKNHPRLQRLLTREGQKIDDGKVEEFETTKSYGDIEFLSLPNDDKKILTLPDGAEEFLSLPNEDKEFLTLPSGGDEKLEFGRLLLGETHVPTEEELFEAIEREQPSLPFRFWYLNEEQMNRNRPNSCALLPDLFDLRLYNQYWQTFETSNLIAQLFSAHYDDRPTLPHGVPVIRILAMINQTKVPQSATPTAHCQLWYDDDDDEPLIAAVTEFRMIWFRSWGHKAGQLYPYLLTCPTPADRGRGWIPQAVSLVGGVDVCATASNLLRVQHRPRMETKRGFVVCVKGLDFPYEDLSARLIEWIELQRLLGADRIVFHQLQMHANVTRVLRRYEREGFVELRPLTLARGRPSSPHLQHYLLQMLQLEKRLNELIPYNDCFYRHVNTHEFVVLLDIDEVAMPVGGRTQWADLAKVGMMQSSSKCDDGYASFCLRNVYFPPGNGTRSRWVSRRGHAPSYMYMLQHTHRSRSHLGREFATKCLHRTDRVLTLHNHFPRAWLGSCAAYSFDPAVAQLQHYRDTQNPKDLEENVEDLSIWRYRDELVERSEKVFRELGFLADP